MGTLTVDNNTAARALRRLAVGRNNWHFSGSDQGGLRAAILNSLIASARLHGLDPFAYLRGLFERLPTHPRAALAELTPATGGRFTGRSPSGRVALVADNALVSAHPVVSRAWENADPPGSACSPSSRASARWAPASQPARDPPAPAPAKTVRSTKACNKAVAHATARQLPDRASPPVARSFLQVSYLQN